MADSQQLFTEFTLNNGVRVPSRLAVAPITLYSSNPDGSVSDAEREFLKGRAEGVGLYILGATLVHDSGQGFPGQPRAIRLSDLEALKERARIVKEQGALAICQIHHAGILGLRQFLPEARVVGPSDDTMTGAEEMSSSQAKAIIRGFAFATKLCIDAGFDGVEIHGANRYLLQQFFSAKTNRRNDKWGGSLKKRMRFPLSVVDAVLAARDEYGSKDFIVGYRLSPEEPDENGITMAETAELIAKLIKRPLQYIHVSQKDFEKNARRGADRTKTRLELIREQVGNTMAVIGLGDLFTGPQFEKALATGWVDFVGTARAIMMNPELARLIREGKDAEIEKVYDPEKAKAYRLPPVLYPRLPGFYE